MTIDLIKNISAGALCIGIASYCVHRIWRGRRVSLKPKFPIDISTISYEDNPANWYLHKPGEK